LENVKVRAHVYVSGRVQGVFFRNEIANFAERLGVTGWVRNLSDGRVEALFEGEKEKIEEEIEFCKRGPPGAAVQNLQVKWEEYTGEFREFNVLY
jgi:acylphosphatase